MSGRCILEDSVEFFKPILMWIKSCNFSTVRVEVNFEYVNSSGTAQIYAMFNLLKENYNIKNVYTTWYYEEEDDDGMELGKDIESMLKVEFKFVKCEEEVE